ncbi:MAG: protein rep, partial [Methanophagales archaeon]|nr:protein rep [Methanophagales archaeon]
QSFRRLRQRAIWKNAVDGGCYVLEITGVPGNWHGHIHAVIYSRWMNWDKLLKVWIKVSGGRGVWIQNIPPSVAKNYITKYITKPAGISDEAAAELEFEIKGYRLFNPFGSWYNRNLEYRAEPYHCPRCGRTHWICIDYLDSNGWTDRYYPP